jgi:RNA polymerase-binding transcription factor DksA
VDEKATRSRLKQLQGETVGLIGALAAELAALRQVLVRDPSTEGSYVATMQRLDAAKRTSVEVEAALARLEEGAYGWCVICLEPIHGDRLRLRPQASHCVMCS